MYVSIFHQRPHAKARFSVRREFWTGIGAAIRLDRNILHYVQEIEGRPSPCVWCEKRPQTGYECLFCGETLCLNCEKIFHFDVDPTVVSPNKRRAGSGKSKKMKVDDAPIRQPDLSSLSPVVERHSGGSKND